MRNGVAIAVLVVVATVAAADPRDEPVFVPARPPKAGLWENSIGLTAKAPSDEVLALLPKAVTDYIALVTYNKSDTTPTSVTEQVCWSEADLEEASRKTDLRAALLRSGPQGPCKVEEPVPGATALFCRLDDDYVSIHSYSQRLIDNDTFTAAEFYTILNRITPTEPVMSYEIKIVGRWLGADCQTSK